MVDLLAAMERNEKELYAMNKKRFDEMLFAWDALKSLLLK